MDELRWVLEQRDRSSTQQPMILPLLYPSNVVRAYTPAQLNDMSLIDQLKIKDMLTAGTIEVNELSPLVDDLRRLVEEHTPPPQVGMELPTAGAVVSLQQRIRDLEKLAEICVQRADACGR